MESKAKLFGHPIHPMLVVFPLGLLITAVIFDGIYLGTGRAGFSEVAFWNISAGIIGGLLAAVFGLLDWTAIPAKTRAKAIGAWHGVGNVVVVGLFAVVWLMRWNEAGHTTSTLTFVLELVAVGLGAVTGWLGGELVDRLGVGVAPGAHVNASSSLSGKPVDSLASRAK